MILRRLGAEDAALWRDVWLRAVRCDPVAFEGDPVVWASRPMAGFARFLVARCVHAAFDGAAPVGFAAWYAESPALAWIGPIWTAPQFRRRGLASALLNAVLAARGPAPDDLCLEVARDNKAARAFYARHGFTDRTIGATASGDTAMMNRSLG